MASHIRKDSMKFDGTNYDSWKEKIKSHFLFMGPRCWLISKNAK
jgi:hypothetical protein